jgi:BirA family biotin operon repressor/biotin-[acetyl-CoA-carboxylase] ligase
MDWRVDALRRDLDPLLPGLRIEVVEETPSTNTDLLERARSTGRIAPCLLVAEQQTGGRGRLGRRWHSAPGASLTFSLALPLAAAPGLSLAVGVALADALEPPNEARAAGALRIGLKWPNDLWLIDQPAGPIGRDGAMLPGRKLAGILIETVSAANARTTVIGVGINIAPLDEATAAVSTDVADATAAGSMSRRGALGPRRPADGALEMASGYAWLRELDARAEASSVLQRLAPALLQALPVFQREGFGAFRERYAARDLLRGRAVTTTQPGAVAGIAQGVADDGCLLLQASATLQRIASGEVSVRMAAPGATAA